MSPLKPSPSPRFAEIDRLPYGFERTASTCCRAPFLIPNPAIPWMYCSGCGRLLAEYAELRDMPHTVGELVCANMLIRYPLDTALLGLPKREVHPFHKPEKQRKPPKQKRAKRNKRP